MRGKGGAISPINIVIKTVSISESFHQCPENKLFSKANLTHGNKHSPFLFLTNSTLIHKSGRACGNPIIQCSILLLYHLLTPNFSPFPSHNDVFLVSNLEPQMRGHELNPDNRNIAFDPRG